MLIGYFKFNPCDISTKVKVDTYTNYWVRKKVRVNTGINVSFIILLFNSVMIH